MQLLLVKLRAFSNCANVSFYEYECSVYIFDKFVHVTCYVVSQIRLGIISTMLGNMFVHENTFTFESRMYVNLNKEMESI